MRKEAASYTLKEAVERVVSYPAREKAILRRRFLHWVNTGLLEPAEQAGEGTGTRRRYDLHGVRFAAMLFALSRWMDGEQLRSAAAWIAAELKRLRKDGVD